MLINKIFTGYTMIEYTEISDALKKEFNKNAELQFQIQKRTEEFLSEFWKLKPMLKTVENLELTPVIISAWVKDHLIEQG
jgi:hypothetical protein